jgi:methionyl-tRNA formyltransferase
MRITILTDNPNSWIIPFIPVLIGKLNNHEVRHIYNIKEIQYGDIMLILSCEKLLRNSSLQFHKSNIVVHPSKLPHGKGWSPLAWQVLDGINDIPVSLFEAVEEVDAGKVYLVDYIKLKGHELNETIKLKQAEVMIKMILEYINNFPKNYKI